jgi:hypothetical protein
MKSINEIARELNVARELEKRLSHRGAFLRGMLAGIVIETIITVIIFLIQ